MAHARRPAEAPRVLRSAVLSGCERYRYLLTRTWRRDGRTAVFVLLNPSTADARTDDATSRRCIDFAGRWDCSALVVVNLYAWRATDPGELRDARDPVGPQNDAYLVAAADLAHETGGVIVGGWGRRARPDRVSAVLELPGMRQLTALALTRAGQPQHPLYLPSHLTPQPWTPLGKHPGTNASPMARPPEFLGG
ncbi:DUF1643 domain-containing protein [Streptomyces sp. NPDC002133]|uniref:DUF1643 domain-containing protein n=1 Tax=Streptomyces sp. NPDC002133 TaxID=3154409 RepID=UPI00332A4F45